MTPQAPSSKSGRLSILDLLILVAATAPGLAVTRTLPGYLGVVRTTNINGSMESVNNGTATSGWQTSTTGRAFTTAGRPLKDRPSYWLGHIPYWLGPCLVSWSIATMGLNLLASRLRFRRAIRGPASVACLAVVLALVVQTIRCLQIVTVNGMFWTNSWRYPEAWWSYFWIAMPRLAAYTVAASWLVLRLCRRWTTEPGARGRLGRALGWSWIALGLLSEISIWCFGLNY